MLSIVQQKVISQVLQAAKVRDKITDNLGALPTSSSQPRQAAMPSEDYAIISAWPRAQKP